MISNMNKAIGGSALVGGTGTLITLKATGVLDSYESDLLTETKDYKLLYKPGTVGYDYGRFMLNPNGDAKLGTEREKELRNAKDKCIELYKRKSENIAYSNEILYMTSGNKKPGDYCSITRMVPYTVDNAYTNKNSYKWVVQGTTYYFLSVKKTENQPLGNHIYSRYLSKDQITNKDSLDTRFQDIKSGEDLRKECEIAYKAETKTDQNIDKYGKNAKNYCALKKNPLVYGYPARPD